jgi:hypothetical protein
MGERGWLECVSSCVQEKEEKSVDFVNVSMEPKHDRYPHLEGQKKKK